MKRHQPGLFDAESFPLFAVSAESDPVDSMDAHPDCPFLEVQGAFNHCTLDGMPARIIGRAGPFATIEPIDLNTDSIRCCWQTVTRVLDQRGGAFTRADDE